MKKLTKARIGAGFLYAATYLSIMNAGNPHTGFLYEVINAGAFSIALYFSILMSLVVIKLSHKK